MVATQGQCFPRRAQIAHGLKEGADNITGAVKGTLNTAGGLVWNSIPWWVWIVGAAALFFWMGGGALLKGRLAR